MELAAPKRQLQIFGERILPGIVRHWHYLSFQATFSAQAPHEDGILHILQFCCMQNDMYADLAIAVNILPMVFEQSPVATIVAAHNTCRMDKVLDVLS